MLGIRAAWDAKTLLCKSNKLVAKHAEIQYEAQFREHLDAWTKSRHEMNKLYTVYGIIVKANLSLFNC